VRPAPTAVRRPPPTATRRALPHHARAYSDGPRRGSLPRQPSSPGTLLVVVMVVPGGAGGAWQQR
jgi:hypothetical protein